MTSPIKALLALAALLPASLGAAVLAILLDVARNAHDRAEAAEHRESERRGERDEARSALAESERERLIAAGQLAKERAISDGLSQSLAKHQVALIDARAEVERLTREAARENEANTADRAAVERLTVDNDGLRGDLKRAERSGLRAAFQLLDVRRDLDTCYAIGWEAIVERDAARVKAEQWERSWTSQGWQMEERRKDARDLQRRIDAAIARAEKAEEDATQARAAEQAAYEREAAVGRRAATGAQMEAARVASATAAAPTQDDLDDQAVRELLSRGEATWAEISRHWWETTNDRDGDARAIASLRRVGAATDWLGRYSLPAAPEATEREGGT